MILQSLAGLPAFLVYFCTAIIAVVAYLFVYTRVTAHNEFDLIRANEPAAAIALGLSLLGSCCRWSVPSPIPPMSGTA
jgi:putative membrane protein